MAALLTIDLVARMNYTHVVFEGDAQAVVDQMNNHESTPNWRSFATVEEARNKLKSGKNEFQR
ncbi:hypothetical protein RJ640_013320 [Escallonia rubra]|uniref:RNase H type-1 domain-containing protein n=1 Tax=Escallonia rubra TaxID=112253 RepID=A0AA88UCU9_9ASTE|nr:hypothetical protein RJ640_013320 [Escallonia rubra]